MKYNCQLNEMNRCVEQNRTLQKKVRTQFQSNALKLHSNITHDCTNTTQEELKKKKIHNPRHKFIRLKLKHVSTGKREIIRSCSLKKLRIDLERKLKEENTTEIDLKILVN